MIEPASVGGEVDAALREWRGAATQGVLLALAVIGLPVTVCFFAAAPLACPWPAKWIGLSLYGAVVVAACWRRLPSRWRALLLLGNLYALATQQLFLTGLAGEGRIFLLEIPLLALVLLGPRPGWTAAAISTLLFAVFTALAADGRLLPATAIREPRDEFWRWFVQGLVLLGALIPLMVLVTRFLDLLLRTMMAEREARLARDDFSRQLIAAQEGERRRLAGELHDELGQDLLVIANQAQLGVAKAGSPADNAARLTEIAEMAKHALRQVRRMAHNLRPGLLEQLGFTEAVEASAEKAAQASGMSMKLDLANVDGLLPPEFEVNLFRILQEGLNNVLKHAAATETRVTLAHEASSLRLIVEDNGRGFDPALLRRTGPDQRGLGIRQILERAGMMGGRLDLQSRPGQGTRLVVEVPMNDARSSHECPPDQHGPHR